jgi:hypothetical protein
MSAETGNSATEAASPTTTTTATTAHPAGQGGTPNQQAASQPQTVTIPLEQLQMFTNVQAKLAQMEADQRSRDEASRAAQVKILTEKGDTEKAMALQQEEHRRLLETERVARASSEERAKRFARDAEVSRVLATKPLVPGGSEQLAALFAPGLQVDASGDTFAVRTATFQSVPDYISEQLARPEYAHFLRAQNPGGGIGGVTGGGTAAPTSPTNPATPQNFKNFGEAIVAQMQAIAKEAPSDSRLNPAAAMGLNSRSIVRSA